VEIEQGVTKLEGGTQKGDSKGKEEEAAANGVKTQ
jgi:hypothetical protein